jgi:hypothetical protein
MIWSGAFGCYQQPSVPLLSLRNFRASPSSDFSFSHFVNRSTHNIGKIQTFAVGDLLQHNFIGIAQEKREATHFAIQSSTGFGSLCQPKSMPVVRTLT